MDKKVIEFPAPSPAAPPVVRESERIVLQIGGQRIAFEFCCEATLLGPALERPSGPPVHIQDGKAPAREGAEAVNRGPLDDEGEDAKPNGCGFETYQRSPYHYWPVDGPLR
jgi:hypothetical protein